jgi:quercetin dioxygenase-like cupin family protein
MIIQEIINLMPSSDKVITRILRKYDQNRIIAIGLKKGLFLPDHITDVPALLIPIQGKVYFRSEVLSKEVQALEEVEIPLNVVHSLEALEDSICILIKG